MARTKQLHRSTQGEGAERSRDDTWWRRVNPTPIFLGLALLVCVAGAGFLVDRPAHTAQALFHGSNQPAGRLTAGVVETSMLDRTVFGQVRFEGWGARATRLVPVALRSEISSLHEHRDRLRDQRRFDPHRYSFPDLPVVEHAPKRMDGGYPDPDRLLPSSRPVTEGAR